MRNLQYWKSNSISRFAEAVFGSLLSDHQILTCQLPIANMKFDLLSAQIICERIDKGDTGSVLALQRPEWLSEDMTYALVRS